MQIIVVAGMDGAGKTTLVKALLEYYGHLHSTDLHLPYSSFVPDVLSISGKGSALGDVWTDRLVFALDNRLVGYKIRDLQDENSKRVLIMQRGWMDSYIFGAVQGVDYGTITDIVRPADLPKVTCSIYLNCQPTVAHQRIKADPKKDKFEVISFMRRQFEETKRFYDSITIQPSLQSIFPEPRLYIDTTHLQPDEILLKVMPFLQEHILTSNTAMGREL